MTGNAVIEHPCGHDIRRVQVLRLARTTAHLFGAPLAGTLATLINIARDLPELEVVTRQDVGRWIEDALPH